MTKHWTTQLQNTLKTDQCSTSVSELYSIAMMNPNIRL